MLEFLFFFIAAVNFVAAVSFSNLNPRNPFLLIFSPLLQLVLFDFVFYFIHGSPSDMLELVVSQSLLILSFYLGTKSYNLANKKGFGPHPQKIDQKKLNLITKYLFVLGILTIGSIFFLNGISPAQLLDFKAFSKFYSESRKGGGASLHLFIYAIFFAILLVACRSRRILHFGFAATLITLASILGGRGFILSGLLAVSSGLMYLYDGKAFRYLFVLGGVFAATTFVGGSFLRSGSLEFYLERVLSKDIDIFHIYDSVSFATGAIPWTPLGFANDINLLIPSAFSLNKPPSTYETISLFSEAAEHGTNITLGLYSNALFAFGSFGIFVLALFYGALGRLFKIMTFQRTNVSPERFFLLSILFSFQLLWLRGGLFNVRLIPVLLCLCLAVAISKVALSLSFSKSSERSSLS